MIAYTDGNILSRAPQYVAGDPAGTCALFTSVWGPAELGDGYMTRNGTVETKACAGAPGPATRDQITDLDFKLLTGNKTVVSYADGHVKVVPTGTLYSSAVRTNKWAGGARDNKGWSR
jgi:prepilin-type processing-associated H-X9-DG protein